MHKIRVKRREPQINMTRETVLLWLSCKRVIEDPYYEEDHNISHLDKSGEILRTNDNGPLNDQFP
jgi:hypothetical protein